MTEGWEMTKRGILIVPSILALIGFAGHSPTASAAQFHSSSQQPPSILLSTLDTSNRADGWDRGGRYRGYRHGHRRYDDNIDAGDVIAGVLLIGGALAVVNAISNSADNNRDRYPYPRDTRDYPDERYRPSPVGGPMYSDGMQRAIEGCVSEVERTSRIATIDTASRSGAGWSIGGELRDGESFHCEIDGSGRIRDVDFGRGTMRDYDDRQPYSVNYDRPSDDYYAQARSRYGTGSPDIRTQDGAPATSWDEGEEVRGWERGEGDDRYDTADGPTLASAD